MTQSITLTASMRSNLASLKSIQGQMDTTQTRLSTGKKVNSAIDNASSYYQSRALTNRAADLDSLLDSMGQGIQTIQAANEGIEAVTSFIEQAKSVANSAFALDTTLKDYSTQLKNYQDQFNDILKEIKTLAQDSSYQGVNLLTGSNLTVMFNETRTHSLDVQGEDIVTKMAATNIGFDTASWATAVVNAKTALDAAVPSASAAGATDTSTKTYYTKDSNGFYIALANSAVPTTITADMVTAGTYFEDTGGYKTAYTAYRNAIDTAATGSVALVNASLDSVAKATDYLRDFSSALGNNFSIIETRQNFTESLIDVLETGSDNLVLADMNEESANYLALQTRQQLAINSLALASQSAQSVLKLF